jgi:hypothetical protein
MTRSAALEHCLVAIVGRSSITLRPNLKERKMAKGNKAEAAPKDKKHGEHGGNRSSAAKDTDKNKKSSQAAGKDPHRSER